MGYVVAVLRWVYDFLAEDNLLMAGTLVSLALLFGFVALGLEWLSGVIFALLIILTLYLSLRAELKR